MKTTLYIVLFLCSITTFSQKDKNDQLKLLDSINSINSYERLYSAINQQATYIEYQSEKIEQLRKNQSELKAFFFRQYIYRKIFDQLELGIIPDSLDSEKHSKEMYDKFNLNIKWIPFKIPHSFVEAKIIIFMDPFGYPITPEISNFKLETFTDICLSFKNGDTILEKRYPKVFALIKSGTIIFENPIIQNFNFPPVQTQVLELEFPTRLFTNTDNSLASKKKLAENLLSWINEIVAPILNDNDKTRNIIPAFLKIEKEKFKQATVDQKIEFRIKFIEYLKKNKMLWN